MDGALVSTTTLKFSLQVLSGIIAYVCYDSYFLWVELDTLSYPDHVL